MSTALRSLGLLDVPSSTPAGPSVARLVSTPVCAASLRNPLRKFYIKNASVGLDFWIVFQTVKIVLLGRGAK